MEYLDLVDSEDRVIGKTLEKGVHDRMEFHRGVQIFIFSSGKMLVEKRSKKKETYPGYYNAGVSGHVMAGETYDDAAVRELREETGIEGAKPVFVAKVKATRKTLNTFLHVYELHYDGTIVNNPSEAELFEWMSLDEIRVRSKNEPFVPLFLECIKAFEGARKK